MCAARIVRSKSDQMGWLLPVSSLSKSSVTPKIAKSHKSVHFAQTEATELSLGDEFQYSDSFESETRETTRTTTAPTKLEVLTDNSNEIEDAPPSYSFTFEETTEKPSKEKFDGYTDTFENTTFSSDTASQQDTLSPGNSFSSTFSTRADELDDEDSNTENTMSSSWISRYSDEEASLNDSYSYLFEDATQYTSHISDLEFERERQETEEQRKKFIYTLLSRLNDDNCEALLESKQKVKGKPQSREFKTYCKRKIKLLTEKKKCGEPTSVTQSSNLPQPSAKPLSVRHYGIDPGIVERLKLENLHSRLEKVIDEPIHDPKTCLHCRAEDQNLNGIELERNFLKSKTLQLAMTSMDEKIQHHLVKMNSVNLIAEIARTLPRHSEDPLDIISELNKPLRDKMLKEKNQQQS